MRHRQVLQVIPFERLRPSSGWGGRARAVLLAGALAVLTCHGLARLYPLPEAAPWLITVPVMIVVLAFHGRPGVADGSSGRHAVRQGERPGPESALVAWTRSGDVVELIFDSGAWLLVRGDVNDRQWRDVQRLLLWCKRVPARMNPLPQARLPN